MLQDRKELRKPETLDPEREARSEEAPGQPVVRDATAAQIGEI